MIVRFFKPNSYIKNVYQLDVEKLAIDGYKLLLCDIDNTLVAYDVKEATPQALQFFKRCKTVGLKVVLCSNNTHERVSVFANSASLDFVSFFCKPLKKNYKNILKKYNVQIDEIVCVGDQLCTDILGGNRFKIHTVFLDPFVNVDSGYTKYSRFIERRLLSYLKFRKKMVKGEYYGYKM